MILDAHHHLWRYDPLEYSWISGEMNVLARDYAVSDLRATALPEDVVGSIAVQARQSIEETNRLLEIADGDDFVRGVVGWAPLSDPQVGGTLDTWSNRRRLVGLRHVVQDEPDEQFLRREDFNQGIAEAIRRGYAYDLLVFAHQLPEAIRFVDRHASGRFVLDHIGKPAIKRGGYDSWRHDLQELARRPNVYCKISGVATEAEWDAWTIDSIRPYLDAALNAFGPDRLMYGSDWPVCLLATGYGRWIDAVRQWAADWSDDERDAFFFRTATRFYRLPDCE